MNFTAPALSAIRLQKLRFSGGITVNKTSQFELQLDEKRARYVGHPSRELDAEWDRLVGKLQYSDIFFCQGLATNLILLFQGVT